MQQPGAHRVVLPGRRVSYTTRFFGDASLEYALIVLTLGLGWFVWFTYAARRGQTPAKQLLRVHIYDVKTGAIASTSRVYMREIGGKVLLPLFLTWFGVFLPESWVALVLFVEAFHWLGIATIFFNRDRRALWDFHAGTVPRQHTKHHREVEPPTLADFAAERLELDRLWGRGTISSEEYSIRLRELLAKEAAPASRPEGV